MKGKGRPCREGRAVGGLPVPMWLSVRLFRCVPFGSGGRSGRFRPDERGWNAAGRGKPAAWRLDSLADRTGKGWMALPVKRMAMPGPVLPVRVRGSLRAIRAIRAIGGVLAGRETPGSGTGGMRGGNNPVGVDKGRSGRSGRSTVCGRGRCRSGRKGRRSAGGSKGGSKTAAGSGKGLVRWRFYPVCPR